MIELKMHQKLFGSRSNLLGGAYREAKGKGGKNRDEIGTGWERKEEKKNGNIQHMQGWRHCTIGLLENVPIC